MSGHLFMIPITVSVTGQLPPDAASSKFVTLTVRRLEAPKEELMEFSVNREELRSLVERYPRVGDYADTIDGTLSQ